MNAQALKKFVDENQKLAKECEKLLSQCRRWENECSLYDHDREALMDFANEADERAKEAEMLLFNSLLTSSSSENSELLLVNKELNNNIIEVQKGQEFAMVQHAEECHLAEERIQILESEAESNLSRKSELELLVSKSEEKINALSKSARLSDTKMQDLILKFTALESERKYSREKLEDVILKKVAEVNTLQGDIDRHKQHLDALEKQVDKLQTTLEEKEQLVLQSKDREKELEDENAEHQVALVDAEIELC